MEQRFNLHTHTTRCQQTTLGRDEQVYFSSYRSWNGCHRF